MTQTTHTIEINAADSSDCPEMTSEEFNARYIEFLTSEEPDETVYRGTVGEAVVTLDFEDISREQAVAIRQAIPFGIASYIIDILEKESAAD